MYLHISDDIHGTTLYRLCVYTYALTLKYGQASLEVM